MSLFGLKEIHTQTRDTIHEVLTFYNQRLSINYSDNVIAFMTDLTTVLLQKSRVSVDYLLSISAHKHILL